jgi:hypothetical protein
MGWVWVLAVLAVMVGSGMLIDHRRYRGVPIPPGVSGRAKRRAIRQGRAALARSQTPALGHRIRRLPTGPGRQ